MIEFTIPLWPVVIAAGLGGGVVAVVIAYLVMREAGRQHLNKENDRARSVRVLRRRHMDLDPVGRHEDDSLPKPSEVKAYHGEENVDWKGHKIKEPRV